MLCEHHQIPDYTYEIVPVLFSYTLGVQARHGQLLTLITLVLLIPTFAYNSL